MAEQYSIFDFIEGVAPSKKGVTKGVTPEEEECERIRRPNLPKS